MVGCSRGAFAMVVSARDTPQASPAPRQVARWDTAGGRRLQSVGCSIFFRLLGFLFDDWSLGMLVRTALEIAVEVVTQ